MDELLAAHGGTHGLHPKNAGALRGLGPPLAAVWCPLICLTLCYPSCSLYWLAPVDGVVLAASLPRGKPRNKP